jgi:hypothetical protein
MNSKILTKNIAKMIADSEMHVASNRLAQRSYQTCVIGCLSGTRHNRPDIIKERYGLPLTLIRLIESVYERLPKAESQQFYLDFPRAIGADGKDLTRVSWAFLGETLRALPEQPVHIQAVIDPVIAGMDLLAAGKEWAATSTEAEARAEAWAEAWAAAAAARAAEAAAAGAAAEAAAEAAWAAWAAAEADSAEARAWAAEARAWAASAEEEFLRQRDSLLRLMRDAPVGVSPALRALVVDYKGA